MYISGDATAKNIVVCVFYLWCPWERRVYKARCSPWWESNLICLHWQGSAVEGKHK